MNRYQTDLPQSSSNRMQNALGNNRVDHQPRKLECRRGVFTSDVGRGLPALDQKGRVDRVSGVRR